MGESIAWKENQEMHTKFWWNVYTFTGRPILLMNMTKSKNLQARNSQVFNAFFSLAELIISQLVSNYNPGIHLQQRKNSNTSARIVVMPDRYRLNNA